MMSAVEPADGGAGLSPVVAPVSGHGRAALVATLSARMSGSKGWVELAVPRLDSAT